MKPLTRDQSDVLKALASHGGEPETAGGLGMRSSRMGKIRAADRDAALVVLERRGLARRAEVSYRQGAPNRTVRADGWAATAEGLVALQREGVGA